MQGQGVISNNDSESVWFISKQFRVAQSTNIWQMRISSFVMKKLQFPFSKKSKLRDHVTFNKHDHVPGNKCYQVTCNKLSHVTATLCGFVTLSCTKRCNMLGGRTKQEGKNFFFSSHRVLKTCWEMPMDVKSYMDAPGPVYLNATVS